MARWLQLCVVLRLLLRLVLSAAWAVPQVGQPVRQVLGPLASRLLLLVTFRLLLPTLFALLVVSVLAALLRHLEGAWLGGAVFWPLLWPLVRWLLRPRLLMSLAWWLFRSALRTRRSLSFAPHWSVAAVLLRVPVNRASLLLPWLHVRFGPEPVQIVEW